ncbi:pentapeptide repeat-containing protein [Legionella nagasakiensis]|uniref:pentapeptide repeat-containing protein n=1 Tax=Legionella nagasakiensis TaxID=535290 RepID=UPI001056B24E|nr:pentapeptide repeat-containing protein [Legionella nagasakiensis]
MKPHRTLNCSGKALKRFERWVIWLFFLLIQAMPAVLASDSNQIKDPWPNNEQLQVIEQTIQSYPLEKQLVQPHRYFLTNAQPVNVVKQTFDKTQDYSQTTFQEEVSFFLTTFKKPVKFILAVFMKDVIFSNVMSQTFINFEWAVFKENASFTYNQFDNQTNFYQAVFKKTVNFYSSKFMYSNFTDVNFDNDAIFTKATFKKTTLFIDASFAGHANFNEASFAGEANFGRTIFQGDVTFNRATFKEFASFSYAQFHGHVSFNHTELPKHLDFSYVTTIRNIINFNNINELYNYKTKINLVGTDISKLKLDYSFFSLHFPEGTSDADVRNVYEDLIKLQEYYGYDDGYKKIMIEYNTYNYLKNKQYIKYFFDKYMWNFGFDKTNLILIVIYIIIFWSLINNFFYTTLEQEVYHIPFLNIQSENKVIENNVFLRYLFYLPLSLIYTVLIIMGGFLSFHTFFPAIKKKNLFLAICLLLMVISGIVSIFLILKFIVK